MTNIRKVWIMTVPWLNKAMDWARKNGSNGWMRFAVGGTVVAELPTSMVPGSALPFVNVK